MAEESNQRVQALYWFVDDDLRPLPLRLGDAKVFCFFSTRWNAESFRQSPALPPGKWTMLSTESLGRLLGLCESAAAEGFTDFALDPPPNYDGRARRWDLEGFKEVVRRPARG